MSRKVFIFTPKKDAGCRDDSDLMKAVDSVHKVNPIDVLYVDVHQKFRGVSPAPTVSAPSATLRYCETNSHGEIRPEIVEDASDFLAQITSSHGQYDNRIAYVNRTPNGNIERMVSGLDFAGIESERMEF